MKCSLQKPEHLNIWSEKACSKFIELSADGQTIFTLKKISTGETSLVQLLLNDQDIVPILLEADRNSDGQEVTSAEDRLSVEGFVVIPDGDKNESTDEVNMAPWTDEGYVTEIVSLDNLKIEVGGKPKDDIYKLARDWDIDSDNNATEKFKEINKEGN